MTSMIQAGVCAAEAMLARATKARARVDFMKSMVDDRKGKLELDGDGIAQRFR